MELKNPPRLGSTLERSITGYYPPARGIAELGAAAFQSGQAVPPEQALPVYVRDEVVVKKHLVKK